MNVKIPNTIVWTITNKCNLRCTHCSISELDGSGQKKELDTARCLELIKHFAQLKIFGISFTGGEPLVRDDIKLLLRAAYENGIICTLATNGVYVNGKVARFLSSCKVPMVAISIDGWDSESHNRIRGTGTFQKAVKAIKLLNEVGINVSVSVAIGRHNYQSYERILNFLSTLPIESIRIQVVSYFGRREGLRRDRVLSLSFQELKTLGEITRSFCKSYGRCIVRFACNIGFLNYEYLKDWLREVNNLGVCGIGTDTLMIRPDGSVTTCIHGYLNETLGNLRNKNLDEILESSTHILQKWYNKTHVNGNCVGCDIFPTCKGGCRALAELESGRFFDSDPNCKLYARKSE